MTKKEYHKANDIVSRLKKKREKTDAEIQKLVTLLSQIQQYQFDKRKKLTKKLRKDTGKNKK